MRKIMVFVLAIVLLCFPVHSLSETKGSNIDPHVVKFFEYLKTMGVIVTNEDVVISDTVNDPGSKVKTLNYNPTSGIYNKITYIDDVLTSYMLIVDVSYEYAKDMMTEVILCYLMSHLEYTSTEAGNILDYLFDTLDYDAVFETSSRLERDSFDINLTISKAKTLTIEIYPKQHD